MSRAFVKDESWEEPVVAPRAPLPDGVPNYVTPRGLQLLRDEQATLEAGRQAIEADPALDDALGRDDLGRGRVAGSLRDLDRLDQRLADVADDGPARRLALGIEAQGLEDLEQDRLVVLGLRQVLLPLLLQVRVLGAAEGRLVDQDAALLGLQGLVEQLVDLVHLHGGFSPREAV